MKEENVNVLSGNEFLVDRFIREIYGSPYSWGKIEGGFVKGYPGFKIESRKEFMKENYKTKIVIGNINDNKIKEKLVYFATTKGLSFFKEWNNIEKIAKEVKLHRGVFA